MKAVIVIIAVITLSIFSCVSCTRQITVPAHGQRVVHFTRVIEWKETITPERTSEVLSSKRIDTTICITVVGRECNNDNTLGNVHYTYWEDETSEVEYAQRPNGRALITAYTIYTSDTTGITYSGVR